MSRQPAMKQVGRAIGMTFLVTVIFLLGCSTPTQRYHVLSFFFDGVPDPYAPKAVLVNNDAAGTQPVVITASIISRHKPFAENKCDSCHRSASGNIMEFDEAYKMCVKCHKTVATQFTRMHGPVANAACRWCHAPHESTEPALLKDPPIKVCTQCHDQQLLGNDPPEHSDGKTSCITCHSGHGGPERYFLKPQAQPQWPGTGPATQSASAATQTDMSAMPLAPIAGMDHAP